MADMIRSTGPGNGQKLPFTLNITDAAGNPAPVDGVPVFTVSDPALIAISDLAADGMSGFVTNLNVLGTATVHVEADADLGSGVSTIATDSEAINVVDVPAPPATGVGMVFGAAVPA